MCEAVEKKTEKNKVTVAKEKARSTMTSVNREKKYIIILCTVHY